MAKIKSEFYTKREANEAMDKISKYCISVKVFDYNYNAGRTPFDNGLLEDNFHRRDYDDFVSRYSFGAVNFIGLPLINGIYEYGSDTYGSYDIPVPKAILEADVQDDKYSFVKERLYSYGAVSVY